MSTCAPLWHLVASHNRRRQLHGAAMNFLSALGLRGSSHQSIFFLQQQPPRSVFVPDTSKQLQMRAVGGAAANSPKHNHQNRTKHDNNKTTAAAQRKQPSDTRPDTQTEASTAASATLLWVFFFLAFSSLHRQQQQQQTTARVAAGSPEVSSQAGDAVYHLHILFVCTPHAVGRGGGQKKRRLQATPPGAG